MRLHPSSLVCLAGLSGSLSHCLYRRIFIQEHGTLHCFAHFSSPRTAAVFTAHSSVSMCSVSVLFPTHRNAVMRTPLLHTVVHVHCMLVEQTHTHSHTHTHIRSCARTAVPTHSHLCSPALHCVLFLWCAGCPVAGRTEVFDLDGRCVLSHTSATHTFREAVAPYFVDVQVRWPLLPLLPLSWLSAHMLVFLCCSPACHVAWCSAPTTCRHPSPRCSCCACRH